MTEAPDAVREVVARFYRAFVNADRDGLGEVVDPNAVWRVQSDGVLAGRYQGPEGILRLRGLMERATSGTWRPLRADSGDITVSLHHGVVLDRFLAERRELRLDSHEAIVAAVDGGHVVRLFHYVHDPVAYATFWSSDRGVDAGQAARAWVDGWAAAWPAADAAAVASLYAPDVLFLSHPFREPQPPGAYAAWAFADQAAAECRFGEPLVDGDRAAVDWWAVVASRDGSVETLAGTSLLRFGDEGLVVEQRDVWASATGRLDLPSWAAP